MALVSKLQTGCFKCVLAGSQKYGGNTESWWRKLFHSSQDNNNVGILLFFALEP